LTIHKNPIFIVQWYVENKAEYGTVVKIATTVPHPCSTSNVRLL
jgi:hypothetical protein